MPEGERMILVPFTDGSKQLRFPVDAFKAVETKGRSVIDELEKVATLAIIDDKWKVHLREMDELRQSVQNAVFEQKDPLLVYKFEAFQLFQQMLKSVNQEVLTFIFRAGLPAEQAETRSASASPKRDDFSKMKTGRNEVNDEMRRRKNAEKQVMAAGSGDGPQRKLSRAERRAQERKGGKKRTNLRR